MIPDDEQALYEPFGELIKEESDVKKFYTEENIGFDHRAADWMEEWFDETGFRTNEIDLLLVRAGHKLEAIEVKYFSPRRVDSDIPDGNDRYYDGLSQAIALTRTGVDYVSLHHYFHPAIRPLDVNVFGKTVYELKNWHDLPFDYRCFRLRDTDTFHPAQIHPSKTHKKELTTRKNGIDFRPCKPNPLLDEPVKKEAERARTHLKRALNIP